MKTRIILRRILTIIMCLCFSFGGIGNLFDAIITDESAGRPMEALAAQNDYISVDNPAEQGNNAEIKAQLMSRITYDGWDPYSADMTLDEFYALMELYDAGMLPLNTANTAAISVHSALGMALPYAGEPAAGAESGIFIPRTMFLLSGVTTDNSFDDYDNDEGSEDGIYPPGLDRYGVGYKLPPTNWNGIGVTEDKNTGALRAAVIVDGINDSNPHVAGDVNQELFPQIDGYYVKSMSAEGADVSILGVIDKGDGNYVYYYMSMADQSTLVSSTTLPADAKFIINYSLNEHEITYKIEMSDGSNLPADITLDSVFGATRPTKTVDAAYSFNVIAPYGYTMRIFRMAGTQNIELTGTDTVNNGYPLGAEPVYKMHDTKLVPDDLKGPIAMTRNATFYNDVVTEDRTIVAVLTKRDDPVFDAFQLLPNTENTRGRGTSALRYVNAKDKTTGKDLGKIPYDYEDVYAWANGQDSKYDYVDSSITSGGASKGNVKDGNIATADGWGWNKNVDVTNNAKMTYDKETDSYSYQWTFQTNSGDHYLLDTLEINGVAISIPYFPKKSISSVSDEIEGTEGGLNTWVTYSTLPDGASVRVEMLMSFTGNPQHVYRITATGAHSNVTLTNMNLMQYRSGAQEIAVYNLDGVHADEGNTTSQLLAIQHYTQPSRDELGNEWKRGDLGAVMVDNTNYVTGDTDNHGANIRFKLADGYGEPYYLFERIRGGLKVMDGQSSITRHADGTLTDKNPVQPLEGVEGKLDSQYIYGPDDDGWYYIRLTGQNDKMALLTIVAIPVKYVVRYIPSKDFPEEVHNGETFAQRPPENMPTFDHTNSDPSFIESPNGWQYDDNNGFYYDTVNNSKIAITSVVPNDPKSWYKFVDWVVVDEYGNPVQRRSTSKTVSLYSDESEEEEDNAIHITSSRALNVNDVNEYSVKNDGLGGDAISVRVIRLMPTWKAIHYPFKYSVVVDWMDAMGELHQEHFDGYWDDILTDSPDKDLTVFVNKDAEPLQRWLAEHPTYDFWDEINNAVNDTGYVDTPEPEESADPNSPKSAKQKIEASINELYPELARRVDANQPGSLYNRVLTELLNMDISSGLDGNTPDNIDDFSRLGGYAFSVHQNGGKIVIWMCEKKSGLEFRKRVQDHALADDEEFYYTINATSGNFPLEGIYKAYPEGIPVENGDRNIYDEELGEERLLMDSDAWLVKFKDGKIADIIKNDGSDFDENNPNPVTYFTLQHSTKHRVNEGIILYAPVGDYTVTEVGSKSGGAYKVALDYDDWTVGADSNFDLIEWHKPDPENNQWVCGSKKMYIPKTVNNPDYDEDKPDGPKNRPTIPNDDYDDDVLSQVSVGIKYKEGSHNRLYVIQFTNQTSTLAIGNEIIGGSGSDSTFSYEVKLKLSDKIKPLKKDDEDYYYFNYTPYLLDTSVEDGEKGEIVLSQIDNDPDGFNWMGVVKVANHQQLKIITSVPEQSYSDEPDIIKTFALAEDDPEETDSEQAVPANYSVHEMPIPEKYSLKNITANNSSITISKDDSNASGILLAADNHSVTFIHKGDVILPGTGASGVMLFGIFGVLLLAASVGLYLLQRNILKQSTK